MQWLNSQEYNDLLKHFDNETMLDNPNISDVDILFNNMRIANDAKGKVPAITQENRQKLDFVSDYFEKYHNNEIKMNEPFLFPLKDIIVIDIDNYKIQSKWIKKPKENHKEIANDEYLNLPDPKIYETSLEFAKKSGTIYQVTQSGSIHLFYFNDVEHYNSGKIHKYMPNFYGDFRTGSINNETSTGVRFIVPIGNKLKRLSETKIGKAIINEQLSGINEEITYSTIKTSSHNDFKGSPYDLLQYLINTKGTSHNGAWACIYGVIKQYSNHFEFDELWELIEDELKEAENDDNWLSYEADAWFNRKEKEAFELYEKELF